MNLFVFGSLYVGLFVNFWSTANCLCIERVSEEAEDVDEEANQYHNNNYDCHSNLHYNRI